MHPSVKAAWVAGALAVAGALIGAIVTTEFGDHNSASAGSAKPSSSAPRSQPSTKSGLRITFPASGTKVLGSKGVVVKGTASGLTSGESGWLFDSNPNNSAFSEDYNPSVGQTPVVKGNYGWSFLDVPIGAPGDHDQTYTLVIVKASRVCSKKLVQRTQFKRLPSECHIEDETDIIVDYPKRK